MKTLHRLAIVLAALAAAAGCTTKTSTPEEMPALKDVYKDAFKIGCAVNSFTLSGRNPEAVDLILSQFNSLTPDNEMKPESLHPRPDVWNWERADRYVDFAKEHGMFTMGHTLCWHNQTPDFFWNDEKGNPKSHDELVETLRSYIETVCTHFKGRVDAWDVVNEIVSEEGGYRDKGWVHAFGGEEYGDEIVKLAFSFAEKYAPDTELYYNEFNVWRPSKLEGVLHIVKMLKEAGIRIDGVPRRRVGIRQKDGSVPGLILHEVQSKIITQRNLNVRNAIQLRKHWIKAVSDIRKQRRMLIVTVGHKGKVQQFIRH